MLRSLVRFQLAPPALPVHRASEWQLSGWQLNVASPSAVGLCSRCQKGRNRCREGLSSGLLPGGRVKHRGVRSIFHFPALDQDLRNRGQIQSSQVIAVRNAVGAIVGTDWHSCRRFEARYDIVSKILGGCDDTVVRTVSNGLKNGKPATSRRTAVSVNIDSNFGVCCVENLGSPVHARTYSTIRGPRKNHLRTLRL